MAITFEHAAYRYKDREFAQVVLSDKKAVLLGLDEEMRMLRCNIELFVSGSPALNTLLWGEKGGGKSTAVRILLNEYAVHGLKIIEFCDDDFYNIYRIYQVIRPLPQFYFLLFFDDISFDEHDSRYRSFKSIVEGGLEEKPSNLLFIATSNRRHLIAEKEHTQAERFARDADNEQGSLHARFGLTIGFYPLGKEQYLRIVEYYLTTGGFVLTPGWQTEAENYAIERGGRSGRVAQQFAIYKRILE